jgi:hypothetical protein
VDTVKARANVSKFLKTETTISVSRSLDVTNIDIGKILNRKDTSRGTDLTRLVNGLEVLRCRLELGYDRMDSG